MNDLLKFVKQQLNIDINDYDNELEAYIEAAKDILTASGVKEITEGTEYYALYRNLIYLSVAPMYDIEIDNERVDKMFLTQLGILKNAQLNNN